MSGSQSDGNQYYGDEKIGAAGETLATDNLVLDDGKDFVAYEPFAATAASYSRKMKEGTTWATLCLPFAIVQSQETECKFYRCLLYTSPSPRD